MAISRGKSSYGGKREGAGRKPKAFAVLKRRLENERIEDAEYAFALYVAVMRSENEGMTLRLDCAREVMDRVLGKPKQLAEVESKAQILVSIDR
jgi:hypothetical protein